MSLFSRRSINPPATPLRAGGGPSSSSRSVSRIPSSGARRMTMDPRDKAMTNSVARSQKRLSTMSRLTGRTSNVYKEFRPITSKDYQTQMLHQFQQLMADIVGETVEMKQLKNPTKSAFTHYFENIYQLLDDGYRCPSKIDEEIPRIFRCLGYPVPLKTSTMQTISASHTWPHVLAALIWLLSLVQYATEVLPEDILFGSDGALEEEESEGAKRKVAFLYITGCCEEVFSGRMDFARLEAELKQALLEMEDFATSEEGLENKVARLKKEFHELVHQPKEELTLSESIAVLETDNGKLEQFLANIKHYKSGADQSIEATRMKRESVEKESAKIKGQLEAKRKQIENQVVSVAEARDLLLRKSEAEKTFERMKAELKGEQEKFFRTQSNVSQLRESVDSIHKKFQLQARSLISQIQPAGQNWEREFPWDKSPFDPKFPALCSKTIKPGIHMAMNRCVELCNAAEIRNVELEQAIDKHKDELATLLSETGRTKGAIDKVAKEMEKFKQIRKIESDQLRQEVEKLQSVIDNWEKMQAMSCEQKEKELRALQEKRESIEKSQNEALLDREKDISFAIEMVAQFKERMEVDRKEVEELLRAVHAEAHPCDPSM